MAEYPAVDTETEEAAPETTYPAVQLPARKAAPAASPAPARSSTYAASTQEEVAPAEETYRAGEAPPPESRGTTGTWQKPNVAPVRPVPVSETGGEPTPIQREGGIQPQAPPPPDPESIPDWTSVTQTDTYKNASTDDRLSILDNYTEQARQAGHVLAARNKEDPAVYDKHFDEFYSREKQALEPPFSVYDNTAKVGLEAAAKSTAEIASGAIQTAHQVVSPESLDLDLAKIGKMSVDEAKDQRDKLAGAQKSSDEDAARAQEFIKNTRAGVHDDYPGGLPTAINTLRSHTANQKTLDALNNYIDSGGQNVPEETTGEKILAKVKQWPQDVEKSSSPPDQIYLREHPILAQTAKVVGGMAPFIIAGTGASMLEGGTGALTIGADLLTNVSDAFKTHYDGAQEALTEREKNGEYFTPYEKEQMALNDASRASFGVGLWQTAANVILGSAMHGLHVPEGEHLDLGTMKTNLANWFKGGGETIPGAVKGVAAEVGGQVAIQGGAQIASNMADRDSGVKPDQDLMEGVPESLEQGAIFGGGGAVIRGAATAFKLGINTAKVNGFSNRVREFADRLTQPDDGTPTSTTPLTREQALEIGLNEHVPPGFRDSVRAKVALAETAKDQANVASDLDAVKSPQTADAMRKASATDANTETTPVESGGDNVAATQKRLRELQAKKKADAEAKAGKEKPPEGEVPTGAPPPPAEGGAPTSPTPTEGGTPPTPTGGAPGGGAAEEVPTHEETVKAGEETQPEAIKPGASNDDLNAKISEFLGPDATLAQKKTLLAQWMGNVHTEYPGKQDLYMRSAPYQLSHELGVDVRATPGAKWAKHTPQLLAQVRDHFSDYLDQRIAEKNKPPEAVTPTPTVEGTPAEGATAAPIVPPDLLHQAMQNNAPFQLIRALKSGKKFSVTQDELEKYDTFFFDSKIDPQFNKETGNYDLSAERAESPTLATAVSDGKVKKTIPVAEQEPGAVEEEVPSGKKEAVLEKELTPEERENRRLAHEVQGSGTEVKTDLIKFPENSDEYAKETAALPEHPNEKELLEKAYAYLERSHNRIQSKDGFNAGPLTDDVKSAAISGYLRALRQGKDPAISVHLKGVVDDMWEKKKAALRLKPAYQKSLDRPSLAEAEGKDYGVESQAVKLKEKKGPEAQDPSEVIEDKEKAAEEEGEGKKKLVTKLSAGDWQNIHDGVMATITDPQERRSAAYQLRELSQNKIVLPDETKTARGIKQDVHDRVLDKIFDWIRAHPPGGEEETASGVRSETGPGGASGELGAAVQHGPHAPTHEGTVPEQRPAAEQLRPADEKSGRRETGVPGAGQAPPGPAGGVLPGAGGEEGAAGTSTGGAGGERTGAPVDTGAAAKSTGEQAIHIRPREEPAKGAGVGGGAAVGGAAGGPEPASGLATQENLALAQRIFDFAKGHPDLQAAAERYGNAQGVIDRHAKSIPDITPERLNQVLKNQIKNLKIPEAPSKPATGSVTEAAETVPEPATTPDTLYTPRQIAEAMMKKPGIAEDHQIFVEDYHDASDLADHLRDEAEGEEDPIAKYKEWAHDLGMTPKAKPKVMSQMIKKETPVVQAEPNKPKPQTPAAAALKAAPKLTEPEARELEKRIGEGANAVAKKIWGKPDDMAAMGLDQREFNNVNDMVVRIGEMFRGITKGEDFQKAMDTIQQFVPFHKFGEPTLPKEPVVPPEQTAAKIQQQTSVTLAKNLADHFAENPGNAMAYGLAGQDQNGILRTMRQILKDPEAVQRALQGMAQKEGIIDPPTTPGGTESSGVLHSLVPGMKGSNVPQKVTDLISWLRRSPDPELKAFARSLNGNRDVVENMPLRQLNHTAPVVFYHDGELWATPSAIGHQHAQHILAHEIQHAIAQRKVTSPTQAHDFAAAGGWEDLRDELVRSLPADLRDALDAHLPGIFADYDGKEEMDYRYMTPEEKNWVPVLYAAHSAENMLHATFSNRHFRDHLDGIKRADGSTMLDGVQSWGRTIFGDQAFKFADEAHPFVSERPGIPAQFDPKIFDLKDSYPLTEAEENAQRVTSKYQLHNGVDAALRQVESVSDDPMHKAMARALQETVKNNPEIKLGLENRVGGYAGGYDFHGDEVTVNPHIDDHSVEGSILHEVTHAMTVGKVDAFEKGQVHLLTPDEMHAVSESEDLRKIGLNHKNVPEIIKRIAELPTYERREKALLDLFQRRPDMQKWYGLTDTREFLSEVMSNGELQDHLKSIPYKTDGARPKTLLHKVFDTIKRFLGFKDDTVLSRAFDNVATLTGGRRVMEGEITTGNLASGRTMTMQENLLAKRYLDHRSELEGFRGGAATVPKEQLNSWLREYRQDKGMASGQDAYSPRTIAPPETRAHFKTTPELAGMKTGGEILDHLTKMSGVSSRDTDGLRVIADRAFKDKAITDMQYVAAHAALNSREYQTLNKLHIQLGSKENQDSVISRFERAWRHTLTPEGMLPKEFHGKLLEHEKFAQNLAATKIRRKFETLDKAVLQTYKTSKLTDKMREDMNKVLRGDPTPRTMPTEVVNALKDMRAEIDANSEHIVVNDMTGEEKTARIIDNLGTYITRSYRMFDDPSYRFRPESTRYRAAAEKEIAPLLGTARQASLVKAYAEHEANEAARPFAPSSVARQTAWDKAYAAAEAKGKANPAALFIDQQMADWTQTAQNRAAKGLQYGHAFSINSKNMRELSPILNAAPSFRKLMGEEIDPKALYARTVWRQSAFIHSVEMSRESAALGRQNGWLSDKFSNKLSAQIPSQYSHMGELAGKYTTPDIANALTDYAENMRAAQDGVVGGALRSLESQARWMATIGSLQRGIGNIWSGIFSHLNNGYFNPFDTEAINASADLFKSQIMRMKTPELNAYIDQMHKYGLTDKTGNVSLVMDYLKNGPHILARDPLDLAESFTNFAGKVTNNKAYRFSHEALMDLHTFGNLMAKGSQWEREVKRRQQVNDWDVANRGAAKMTPEQLREKAAEIVRNQNISYSLATKTIQQMRKNPTVGTFLTFAGEALRSYGSSILYAKDSLLSQNPIERQIGRARMAGLLTSLVLPGALMMASRAMFGVSNKEDRNFRSLLPPWEQHNSFFYGPTINGRRTYTNLNYNTPQGDVARGINALFAPNPDGIMGQMKDASYELFAPFFNLGLVPGAMIDVYRNQTAYGTPVYNPNDTFWNKTGDMAQHIFHQIDGGTVGRVGSKIIPALTTPGGKVTPGGAVYDLTSSIVPEVFGLNVKEISYPDRFRSTIYSSKDSIDAAQRLFTGPIQQSHNQLTDQQIRALYQRSENARHNAFVELHRKVEAARFGGMNTQTIKTALKSRRYSTQEINDIMTGRYRAYQPSPAILKNARANGNFVPSNLFGHSSHYDDEE